MGQRFALVAEDDDGEFPPPEPGGYKPAISLVAYEEREGGVPTGWIFVKVPNERGRYMRTLRCVVEVSCPECAAVPGEPCRGSVQTSDGYMVNPHYRRSKTWTAFRKASSRGVRISLDEVKPAPLTVPRSRVGARWRRCAVCLSAVTQEQHRSHADRDGGVCAGKWVVWEKLVTCWPGEEKLNPVGGLQQTVASDRGQEEER